MIKFVRKNNLLLLYYEPNSEMDWIYAKLGIGFDVNGKLIEDDHDNLPYEVEQLRNTSQENLSLTIRRTFHFQRKDLIENTVEGERVIFILGIYSNDYWEIEGRKLDIEQNVCIHKSINIHLKTFCTGYGDRISIFKKISKLIDASEQQIIVGGDRENAIPAEEFLSLIKNFPTRYELDRIADARVAGYIQDYLETKKDYIATYEKYSNTKRSQAVENMTLSSLTFNPARLANLIAAREKLFSMLKEGESISEESWQQGILEIIPVLFPQYIKVFSKVKICDKVNPGTKYREVDFLLVDACGNVDVLEIKRGFDKNRLIRASKYRGNFVPAVELSGGIMQIEKYIFYLHNWGPDGERKLTEDFKEYLPTDLKLRFLNPKGLLIMGCCNFDESEQRDFDLIRRKYSNIIDIITYNDLIKRLDRIIKSIES